MKNWKIGIVKDTSKPMLGLHGLHNAFQGLPGTEIVALVDSNSEELKLKMECVRAKRHYLNLEAMLEHESPDIVILCSRHPCDHLPQIKLAAKYGCHIYCEKPLTVELSEFNQIAELVKEYKIKLCMAHPMRYDLGFLTMKRMLEDGEIGKPLCISGSGKCDHRGGGEDLMVLGTHILDYQSFVFGEPKYVMAEVKKNGHFIKPGELEQTVEPIGPAAGDEIFAGFGFANGARGTFRSCRGLYDPEYGITHMGVTITGTNGALSMRFCDGPSPEPRLLISRQPGPHEEYARFEEVELTETRHIPGSEAPDYSLYGNLGRIFPWANRFAAWDLMQAIEEDRLPVSNIYNAGTTLEMIYGIYSSSLRGRRINFPLHDIAHPLKA
jgi:predicted dehydrogenase